jgi:PDZ domain
MVGRHTADWGANAEAKQAVQSPQTFVRAARTAEDREAGRRAPGRRQLVQGLVAVLAAVGLLAAGAMTHFGVRPGRLAAIDKSLTLMQRMGPPPYLLNAYEELNADSAVIRDRSTGRVIAAGMFIESLDDPAALPGFTSLLPSGIKHLLELEREGTQYAVIFVAPLGTITSRNLLVETGPLQLPGTVIRTDAADGLAAIEVTMSETQVSGLVGPPVAINTSAGTVPLPQIIVRRNPGLYGRSAGFVLTSGVISATGSWWCDTPVSGAGAGAPIGYVTPTGQLVLVGLAVPSSTPGRCAILDARTFYRLLVFSATSPPSKMVAYLGVVMESTATARTYRGYRGRAQGAYVSSVELASAADEAGLRRGDVITGINTAVVDSPTAVRTALAALTPGQACTVTFVRDGVKHAIRVVLSGILASTGSG